VKTVALIPYRSDQGHRDRLWQHLKTHYWANLPYPLIVGHHDDGPFNRSTAVNAAAKTAGAWDVAIIADSDTWVPVRQLSEAVRLASTGGSLVSALTAVAELSADCTEKILSGADVNFLDIDLERVRAGELATQSSMLAVPRYLWDRIGGFDEKFAGWGGEDNAFWRAASILGGQPRRLEGYAYHLWHQPAISTADRRSDPAYRINLARWNRYRTARNERTLRQVQALA
jgi:GT2 family glycosyltransferase